MPLLFLRAEFGESLWIAANFFRRAPLRYRLLSCRVVRPLWPLCRAARVPAMRRSMRCSRRSSRIASAASRNGNVARPRQGRQCASEVRAGRPPDRRSSRGRSGEPADGVGCGSGDSCRGLQPGGEAQPRGHRLPDGNGHDPAAKFDIDSVQRPYPIFQQGGTYFSTPDFLNTAHTIDTAADAEAYLSRLGWFGRRSTTIRTSSAPRRLAASSPRPGRST